MGQQQTASVVISKIYLAIASTCLALACSDAAAPAQHVALDVPETVSDTAVAEVFDATVQDAPQTCYSCHGDPSQGNPAPPLGTKGEELPTDRAVGAHQNHLEKSDWHRSVACEECHTVPTALDHSNGKIDFVFSGVAMAASATPSYAADKLQCSGAYCHGVTLLPAKAGGSNEREPIWNMIDGTYNACGTACHTTPPGGKHPQNTNCAQCHGAVIAAFDPATQKATWKDATRHIDGKIDAPELTCTACHGDPLTLNPAPPLGTQGETKTTQAAVGAHQNHLQSADWHRQVVCEDCHQKLTDPLHSNGIIDFAFGAVATAMNAQPNFDFSKQTCASTYCHGTTLLADKTGATSLKVPTWTQVDGTAKTCGAACHTTPPGGQHPQNTNCAQCHGAVIAAFDPATQEATWKDATQHVDGKLDVIPMTCTSCHGNPISLDPAPPFGTQGETKTTQAAVGAHQNHLQSADWHRQVVCEDCHQKLTDPLHSNGTIDFAFGAVATAMNAQPNFDFSKQTCASTYCHGTTLLADKTGATSLKVPTWTQVDGTAKTCGAACHTTPPGGKHPQNTNCAQCHGAVIAAFDPATQKATWKDATRHIDGKIDAPELTCTSCHGNPISLDPAPPFGTQGETKTTQAAVGAHQNHLQSADWHHQVVCEDCHSKPTDPLHSNGIIDFAFGAVATAAGAQPAFDFAKQTCTGSYCHGSQLLADKAGAATQRTPVWTQVDGTAKNCGLACHTTPPGDIHPQQTDCESCHDEVVAKFDAVTGTVTWKNAALHINGVVNGGKYHLLAGWTAPKFTANGAVNPEHHGATYFVANQQRDPNGKFCSDCHGSDWAGGKVAVSCSNNGVGCHGANPAGGTAGNWKACNFCHGNAIHNNPPIGVGNESTTATLAVGRHDVHTSASATHIAFQCSRCHTVPATGDVSHTVQYVPSADLSTAGHHGVVTLPAPSTAYNSTGSMAWNVASTSGAPVTARGTCTGACHSDGRGGAPNVTPYWAGGTWTAGSCANCHAAAPSTKHHPDHLSTDNNVPCADCHPDASSASHLNGLRDVKPTILGTPYSGSITVTTGNTSGCATGVHCSGVCHNEAHTNRCW